MRRTTQKKKLEQELADFDSFFSAEELYLKIVKKNPKIGIATVYRFLKNLVDNGKLHSYTCDRKRVYSLDDKSHAHFSCKRCGKINHFNLKKIDFLPQKWSVCHFQIDVHGICEKCNNNK